MRRKGTFESFSANLEFMLEYQADCDWSHSGVDTGSDTGNSRVMTMVPAGPQKSAQLKNSNFFISGPQMPGGVREGRKDFHLAKFG